MRYVPEHKLEIHRKIVKDASRRVRANGLNGAAFSAVMKDAGLTHGGFYKHFRSKDDLLLESLREGFREIEDALANAAEQSPPGEAWKAIVRTVFATGGPISATSPDSVVYGDGSLWFHIRTARIRPALADPAQWHATAPQARL
jgi:TetR/AcrR family transcriptional repressor of nem operon